MFSKQITKITKNSGASAFGITSAEPLSSIQINKWLDNGYQASMKWLERTPELRKDPKALLPEARSVICIGYVYNEQGLQETDKENSNCDLLRARFARGKEYHKFIRNKLKLICEQIKNDYPKAKFKICVDTSPILEKALAARAGLGWIGKNTLLINPKHGSYLVLGEIITDLPMRHSREPARQASQGEAGGSGNPASLEGLDPCWSLSSKALVEDRDDNQTNNINQCGNCTKCLKACPTGALVKPYILDARRCLSYLTIEHKTEISEEFKKFLKPGQHGCDICQEVCPYNKPTNTKL